ncbi:MAG: hypothetical protein ACRD3V_34105, partial [Vicinamibacteria bacterium]
AEGAEPREVCREDSIEGDRQHLIPSKEPDADDSAVRTEQSRQPERSAERSAEREATSRGGGAPRHQSTSEWSEPSESPQPERRASVSESRSEKRWGWGPTALMEERGEH